MVKKNYENDHKRSSTLIDGKHIGVKTVVSHVQPKIVTVTGRNTEEF